MSLASKVWTRHSHFLEREPKGQIKHSAPILWQIQHAALKFHLQTFLRGVPDAGLWAREPMSDSKLWCTSEVQYICAGFSTAIKGESSIVMPWALHIYYICKLVKWIMCHLAISIHATPIKPRWSVYSRERKTKFALLRSTIHLLLSFSRPAYIAQ